MPFDGPTDEDFAAACAVVSAYVSNASSGRGARNERLRALIGTWSFDLSETERHAGYDAEKS